MNSVNLVHAAIKLVGILEVAHESRYYDQANRGTMYTKFKVQYKFSVELPKKIVQYYSDNQNFEYFASCNLVESFDYPNKINSPEDYRNSDSMFIESVDYWGRVDKVTLIFDEVKLEKIPDEFLEIYKSLVDDSSNFNKELFIKKIKKEYEEAMFIEQLERNVKIINKKLDYHLIPNLCNIVKWYYLGEYYYKVNR
jgi:hypothetical protein